MTKKLFNSLAKYYFEFIHYHISILQIIYYIVNLPFKNGNTIFASIKEQTRMEQIAGLHYETNTQGQILKVAFDFRKIQNEKIAEIIEDLIDGMEAEASRKEGVYSPLDDVLEKQDKKRGIVECIQ